MKREVQAAKGAGAQRPAGRLQLVAVEMADDQPAATRTDDGRRCLVAAMLAERREVVIATILRELHAAVPGYWRMRSAGFDADLRSACTTLFDIFVATLAERRPMSDREEKMLRTVGARRARQGIPVEMLRAAFLVASRVGWKAIIECFASLEGVSGAVATMGSVGEALADFIEMALRVLGTAYQTAEQRGGERAELYASVIAGAVLEHQTGSAGEATHLPVDAHRTHGLILVAALDPRSDVVESATRRAAAQLVSLLPDAVEVPLTAASTAHATIVVPAATLSWRQRHQALDTVRHAHRVLTLEMTAPGLPGLRHTYQRASSLLRLARTVCTEPRGLGPVDLRLHNLLVEGLPDHHVFVEEVLGPILALPPSQREKLLETVTALCSISLRGGLRAAARALEVHEKTVAYRLERIVELTGLDPDHPHHRAQLVLAVELLRMNG